MDKKPKESRQCKGGCGKIVFVRIDSNWQFCRSCYRSVSGTNHKPGCSCGVCKAKRGERSGASHPCTGTTLSKEHKIALRKANVGGHLNKHKKNCQCSFCKGARGETKGRIWLHDPVSGQEKVVMPLEEQTLLKQGFVRGKSSNHIQNNLKSMLKSSFQFPNNFEIKALEYLNSIGIGNFAYTGDGSCIINGKSVDALSTETKSVALFHGLYYHWTKYHPKVIITEQDRRSIEKVDSLPFLANGYKVIFIWEDELNNSLGGIVREYQPAV